MCTDNDRDRPASCLGLQFLGGLSSRLRSQLFLSVCWWIKRMSKARNTLACSSMLMHLDHKYAGSLCSESNEKLCSRLSLPQTVSCIVICKKSWKAGDRSSFYIYVSAAVIIGGQKAQLSSLIFMTCRTNEVARTYYGFILSNSKRKKPEKCQEHAYK